MGIWIMPILLSCISALFNAAFALQLFDACKRLSLSRSLSHSNKSSWLIPPQAQGVLLFKAQSVFSPFHPSEEAELTSADPHSQSPSQLQPASHSFSQSLIHCSFFLSGEKQNPPSQLLSLSLSHSLSFHDLSWEEVKRVHFHSHLDTLHLCCSGLWIKKRRRLTAWLY